MSDVEQPIEDVPSPTMSRQDDMETWVWIGGLSLVLIYAFLNTLASTAETWSSPQYSHGYIVPVFAMVLLWMRREPFSAPQRWEQWLGVGLILFGTLFRCYGAYYVNFSYDRLGIIPCLFGVFTLFGGLSALRWAWAPIAFLVFMFPLPGFLEDRLLQPLQALATKCSLYVLQTLGVEAYREGNHIFLDKVQMGVVDACSGLRMLTIFLALSFAIAMLATNRPVWERIVIACSAVPIALLVNIIRITVTGLLYNLNVKHEVAKMIFHDAAGWIMMPMALGLLYLECQILSKLILEDDSPQVATTASFVPGSQSN